jgi:hypothetical protein
VKNAHEKYMSKNRRKSTSLRRIETGRENDSLILNEKLNAIFLKRTKGVI